MEDYVDNDPDVRVTITYLEDNHTKEIHRYCKKSQVDDIIKELRRTRTITDIRIKT